MTAESAVRVKLWIAGTLYALVLIGIGAFAAWLR
jgi:hypothetical protein